MISKYIDKLREGESLQADEAEQCLRAILESNLPDEQIAELLIAFSEKGETAPAKSRTKSNILNC